MSSKGNAPLVDCSASSNRYRDPGCHARTGKIPLPYTNVDRWAILGNRGLYFSTRYSTGLSFRFKQSSWQLVDVQNSKVQSDDSSVNTP